MASFLSQPTQFTPFIPSVDAESYDRTAQTYVQAGLIKQQQYDQNVQKVQGFIDNISGLQVIREQDKVYLQNKLGELNNQLQSIAGADFSKQQVVNTAGGYAAQIYNDQRIQNSVSSTQSVKDAYKQIETARKEGKSSPSNENAVLRNVNAYLQGGADATLDKQYYTPYYNYSKAWQDFMKDKHGNVIIEQTPFGPNTSRGVAYVLKEGKKEYLDPASVQQDFQTFLSMDSQAANQVQLDALYYSDSTPTENALQSIRNNVQSTLDSYDNSIKILEQERVVNNTTQDRAKIDAQIDAIRDARTKFAATLSDREREFQSNPESAKMRMFMENLTVGVGNRYAYSEIENKIVKNPIFEADIDQQRLEIAQSELLLKQNSEKKAASDAASSLLMLPTGGIDTTPITPEEFISDVNQLGTRVVQNQVKTLWLSGINNDGTNAWSNIIYQGRDSNGNAAYHIIPGQQERFNEAFKGLSESYRKDPKGANPAVSAYFQNADDPSGGLGLELMYFAQKRQIAKIEQDLEQQFQSDPEYKRYTQNVRNLGNSSDIIFTNRQTGTQLNVGALATFSKLAKQLNTSSYEEIARKSNGQLTTQQARDAFFAVSGARTGSSNPNANRILSIFDAAQNIDKYSKARSEAFKQIQYRRPSVSVAMSEDGTNSKQVNDLIALFQQVEASKDAATPDGNQVFTKDLNEVLANEKGQSNVLSVAYELLPSGNINAIVRKNGKSHTINLDAIQARQLIPTFSQQDPDRVTKEVLNAARSAPGDAATTPFWTLPRINNLQGIYQLQYKIRDNGETGPAQQFTPIIQYYQQGTNGYRDLINAPYFNTAKEAKDYSERISAMTPEEFRSTFKLP